MDGARAGIAIEPIFDHLDVLPIALAVAAVALTVTVGRAVVRPQVGGGGALRSLRALGNRRFTLLWIGQTVSRIGDYVYEIVLAWWILELTGSGAVMGSVLIVSFLPVALFTIIGGAVVDRVSRLGVMLVSDVVRAVAVLGVAAWAYAGHLELWPIYALGLLFGVGNAFFGPAYFALVPELVDEKDLPSANALTSMSFQLGRIAGPVIGGLIVVAGGTELGLLLNGLSFVVAAAFLVPLIGRMRRVATPDATADATTDATVEPATALVVQPGSDATAMIRDALEPAIAEVGSGDGDGVLVVGSGGDGSDGGGGIDGSQRPHWLDDVREGYAVVAGSPIVRTGILVNAVAAACLVGPFIVAMPFLVDERFDGDPRVFGFLLAFFPIGFVLGSLWGGRHDKLPHRGRIMYGGIALAAAMLALYGLPVPLYVLAAAALVNGFCLELTGLAWVGLLQDHIPGDKLGRAASFDQLAGFITVPIAFAAAGWATDLYGAAPTFLVGGLLAAVLAVGALAIPAVWRAS